MSLVMPRSQVRQKGLLDSIARILWAVCFVFLFGFISHSLSPRPLGTLLGCAVSVLLAGMLNGSSSAIAALITSALLGAFWLPPNHSLAIDQDFRFAYGTFLVLCILISFYRPPRGVTKTEPQYSQPSVKEAYGEEDLPTIVTADQINAIPSQRNVSGDDLYQWERSVAHLSDLIWDARIRLHEEEVEHALMLLEHAFQVSNRMRAEIKEVTVPSEFTSHSEMSSPSPQSLVGKESQNKESYKGNGRENDIHSEHLVSE